jgi:hypothetical protein
LPGLAARLEEEGGQQRSAPDAALFGFKLQPCVPYEGRREERGLAPALPEYAPPGLQPFLVVTIRFVKMLRRILGL